ncbi:hypothetical protein Y1Q_0007945 [Alligator mississippiensis]|uniref:Reverse transcriptase domain-containing protein n=1 Tax=Alligator mississippiensis TaxID=8496 RepID=A0A151NEY0_ALLMI|nr:hypothetical protein Y1Q_0007945 [Alligator mississippiensis]
MVEELKRALRSFKNSKTPGVDGLPKEFYLLDLVGPDLLELFQECLQEGRLGVEMERVLVTLLYKKGLRKEMKNWKPITLLNFNYKLLAKVLTE